MTPGVFERKKTARGVKKRDVNKCPLYKTCKQGDWQLCTVKKCRQWVHCRCEAQLDTLTAAHSAEVISSKLLV